MSVVDTPVILAFRKLTKDCKFEDSLGYIVQGQPGILSKTVLKTKEWKNKYRDDKNGLEYLAKIVLTTRVKK